MSASATMRRATRGRTWRCDDAPGHAAAANNNEESSPREDGSAAHITRTRLLPEEISEKRPPRDLATANSAGGETA